MNRMNNNSYNGERIMEYKLKVFLQHENYHVIIPVNIINSRKCCGCRYSQAPTIIQIVQLQLLNIISSL